MITAIKIKNPIKKKVPKKGFYVKIKWMYGDADGYKETKVGPFPENRKDILIDFLNVVSDMLRLYPHGKGGYDGYDSVDGYLKFFSEDYRYDYDALTDEEKETRAIEEYVGAEQVYTPDDSGCVASICGYKVYYMDGITDDKYNVSVVENDEKRDFLTDEQVDELKCF